MQEMLLRGHLLGVPIQRSVIQGFSDLLGEIKQTSFHFNEEESDSCSSKSVIFSTFTFQMTSGWSSIVKWHDGYPVSLWLMCGKVLTDTLFRQFPYHPSVTGYITWIRMGILD